MSEPIRIHEYTLKTGIQKTPEFAKKKLANYAVNVGVKCGHGCTYCSSGALLRRHPAFKATGESPFDSGYAIIDPHTPERVVVDACHQQKRGVVLLCTTVDAWCPRAVEHDLGRKCLEAILRTFGWKVRILTKSIAVFNDFDLIQQHRPRVLLGLTLTGTKDKSGVLAAIEPHAAPIEERMAVMKEAHRRKLRTYGMLCPLLPGIANDPRQIDALVKFVKGCGVEEVFAEPVNSRGPGLVRTEDALRAAGYEAEAEAVGKIRNKKVWSAYATQLVRDVQTVMRKHGMIDKLRFLLYTQNLQDEDKARIREDDAGVIWLEKGKTNGTANSRKETAKPPVAAERPRKPRGNRYEDPFGF
jgi:DNA repair photolyase